MVDLLAIHLAGPAVRPYLAGSALYGEGDRPTVTSCDGRDMGDCAVVADEADSLLRH
jgi:hypothetical protein